MSDSSVVCANCEEFACGKREALAGASKDMITFICTVYA